MTTGLNWNNSSREWSLSRWKIDNFSTMKFRIGSRVRSTGNECWVFWRLRLNGGLAWLSLAATDRREREGGLKPQGWNSRALCNGLILAMDNPVWFGLTLFCDGMAGGIYDGVWMMGGGMRIVWWDRRDYHNIHCTLSLTLMVFTTRVKHSFLFLSR